MKQSILCLSIGIDDIEQAWTYANHPEVRAVYFVLSNGFTFHVFRTSEAASCGAIFSVAYADLSSQWIQIANLLAPLSISRDFPDTVINTSRSLGPGLREFARITSGLISYSENSICHPVLNQLQSAISSGSVERAEDGSLIVYLTTQTLLRSMQELNERLGLDKFEMKSRSEWLSLDPRAPDAFEYTATVVLPAGSQLLDMRTWTYTALPINVSCTVTATASGSLTGNRYGGTFNATYRFQELPVPTLEVVGYFHVYVA